MRKSSVNSITYGALFCALIGVLLYANRLLANAIELYFFWIIPIPIIIYIQKFGTSQSLVMSAALVLMTAVINGPISTPVFYVIGSVVAGIVYGDGLAKGRSATGLIGGTIGISLVMMIITTFLVASFFGYDINMEIEYLRELMMQMVNGQDATVIAAMTAIVESNKLLTIVIISYILSSVMEGVLVHLIAFIVLKRLKMQTPPMIPISEIYPPVWLKLIIFAVVLAGLLSTYMGIHDYDNLIFPIQTVAYFILYVFGYIFVITLLSARLGRSKSRGLIAFLVILLSFIFSQVFVGLGLFDIFTNARKKLVEGMKVHAKQ